MLSLRQAIERALATNTTLIDMRLRREVEGYGLAIARRRVKQDWSIGVEGAGYAWQGNDDGTGAGATRGSLSAGPSVTLSLPTGGTVTTGPRWRRQLHGADGAERTTTDFEVALSQPLGKGRGAASATRERAEMAEERARIGVSTTVTEVVRQTIELWRAIGQAKRKTAIASQAAAQARQAAEVVDALIETGRTPEAERTQSAARVAEREIAVLRAREAEEEARSALAKHLGMEPGSDIDTDEGEPATPRDVDEASSRERALARNAGYALEAIAMREARLADEEAKDDERWTLNLDARASFGGPGGLGTARGRISDRGDYQIGLTLDIPIGEGTSLERKKSRAQAHLAWRQAVRSRAIAQRDLEREVRDAVRSVESLKRQARIAEEALGFARRNVEIEDERLRRGLTSAHQARQVHEALAAAGSNAIEAKAAWTAAVMALDITEGTFLERWGIEVNEETGEAWMTAVEPDAEGKDERAGNRAKPDPVQTPAQGVATRPAKRVEDAAMIEALHTAGKLAAQARHEARGPDTALMLRLDETESARAGGDRADRLANQAQELMLSLQ